MGAAGCSSGERSACSTGPARESRLPYGTNERAKSAPACIPRCGTGTSGISLISAVPSGACSVDEEVCTMTVGYPCDGQTVPGANGPVDGVACECVNGSWSCVTTSQGGSACGPVDAGTH